jgi:hypothetical protein
MYVNGGPCPPYQAVRQSPYAMQMLRQEHPGVYLERVSFTNINNCLPQKLARIVITKKRLPSMGYDREEIRRTFVSSFVFRHRQSLLLTVTSYKISWWAVLTLPGLSCVIPGISGLPCIGMVMIFPRVI